MCPTERPGRLEIAADNVSLELHNFCSAEHNALIHTFSSRSFINHDERITPKSQSDKRGCPKISRMQWRERENDHFSRESTIFWSCRALSASFSFFVKSARGTGGRGGKQLETGYTLNVDNGINKSDDIGGTICGKLTRARACHFIDQNRPG